MKNRSALLIAVMSMMIGLTVTAAPPPPHHHHAARAQADAFARLVTSCQRSLQPGMQMNVDPRLHFIIFNIRLLGPAASVKPGAIQMKKPGIIQAIRRSPDFNLYRMTGTTLIYNYVSTDQCVFTLIIAPQEL
ncbi:MAG: hypothetical protein J5806_14045 [Lentisphaeria bacterium]|nr:hypothetical protein [Lentisphaeria bacterium]